jgi:hypothetical protein
VKNFVLCLSGGGFRASLFHLGVLKRLHELGLLSRVRVISAVSGGAVTAALFSQYVTDIIPPESKPSDGKERDFKDFSIAYDWEGFEAALRKATAHGILFAYSKSLTVYMFLALAGALFSVRLLIGDALILEELQILGLVFAVVAVVLYFSMIPLAYRTAVGRFRNEASAAKIGITTNFYSPSLPCLLLGLIYPMSPSAMRTAALDDTLFNHALFCDLAALPMVYLAAVELNRGCEMIFSREVLTELGPTGTMALWEQKPDVEFFSTRRPTKGNPLLVSYEILALSVAKAVAASSAYPPFFRPISIFRGRERLGTFVDGGVLDNAALNAPLELILHTSETRPRYEKQIDEFGRRTTYVGFAEATTDLFVADAGASPTNDFRWWWSSWKSLRRLVDIMFNHQTTSTTNNLMMVMQQKKIKVTRIGLEAGFPLGSDLQHDRLSSLLLGRFRTHFDRFDEIETAILIYTGYFWTDAALGNYAPNAVPRREFREIAASDKVAALSPDQIIGHVAFSHLRLSINRRFLRFIARRSPRVMAAVSLACGMIAFFFEFVGLFGVLLGYASISNMYIKGDFRFKKLALAGIVLSIVASITGVLIRTLAPVH